MRSRLTACLGMTTISIERYGEALVRRIKKAVATTVLW